jgi:UDP-glucose 4-epimerase
VASVLVTGGAGFIGSHTCLELLATGRQVVILDSLVNSDMLAVETVRELSGRAVEFVQGDIRDQELIERLLRDHECKSVLHFAGLKAVGESNAVPLEYYDNNVVGTVSLLKAMKAAEVDTLVFSSSATVYGLPQKLPITEDHPLSATNPYGRTKLMIEDILRDWAGSDAGLRIAMLRYFNPCGAHASGRLGEDPRDVPNNLVPYIAQVAAGQREAVNVFGDGYETLDGTGVRDYIHVVDLARGHVNALEYLASRGGCHRFNLGTGNGYSVLEMIAAFGEACGRELPYRVVEPRPGDVPACYADPSLAQSELGWSAQFDLERMCADHWRWQKYRAGLDADQGSAPVRRAVT